MRILHVVDAYPSVDAPASNPFIHAQAKGLVALGVGVRVFCPTPYVPRAFSKSPRWGSFALLPHSELVDGIAVDRPRFLRPPGKWFRPLVPASIKASCGAQFAQLLASYKPDVVHAHMALPTGLAASRMLAHRMPLVLTVHGLDVTESANERSRLKRLARDALCAADLVLCASDYLREQTLQLAGCALPIQTAYLGIDLELFRRDVGARQALRQTWGVGEQDVIVGHIGRQEAGKGGADLLNAIAAIRHMGMPIRGLFVGNGSDLPALRQLARQLGLEGAIMFQPPVAIEQVPAILSALDVLALPSREEGFGLILAESQACETPVVATRTGGIVEAVRAGQGGLLVASGSARELRDAVTSLCVDKKMRTRMGKAGGAWVRERFDARHRTLELLAEYERLVARYVGAPMLGPGSAT